VVAEAARAANVKGGVVGVVSKASGRVVVQLLYVDAASGKVATLSQMKLQGDLLDIGIESLKARARIEEVAAEAAPTLADADPAEALIEGARAGAGVTLAEVNLKFQVKASRDMPAIGREVVPEDAPIFAQPWFMPTAIAVGAVVVVGVTGGVLFGTGIIPDPRPASGGQVSVTFPAAAP
jgi:energy-converting hydrogenase Eha subunit G